MELFNNVEFLSGCDIWLLDNLIFERKSIADYWWEETFFAPEAICLLKYIMLKNNSMVEQSEWGIWVSQTLNYFVLMVLSFIEIDPVLVWNFTDEAWHGSASKVIKVGRDDWTALMWAAYDEKTDVIQALLEEGADIDKQGRHSNTGLHLASDNHNEVITMLVQYGASVDIDNDRWNTNRLGS